MRKPELTAIACAALIVSGTALGQARGAPGAEAPVSPVGEIGAPQPAPDLARDLGIHRGQPSPDVATRLRNQSIDLALARGSANRISDFRS